MTDQSPPGPPVELGFVDDLPGLRCSPRRRGKLPKICWQVGGESWPSMSIASPENGLLPSWWVTGWNVWWMPACLRGWAVDVG